VVASEHASNQQPARRPRASDARTPRGGGGGLFSEEKKGGGGSLELKLKTRMGE